MEEKQILKLLQIKKEGLENNLSTENKSINININIEK